MLSKEQIVEDTKLIFEFIETTIISGINTYRSKEGTTFPDYMHTCSIYGTKYHSSWDWLMSVVNRIRNFSINGYPFQLKIDEEAGWVYIIHHLLEEAYFIRIPIEQADLKLAVYKAVIEFIKWYNKNKEQCSYLIEQ